MIALPRGLIESGSRTRRRGTFFCAAKRKYPKKSRPHRRTLAGALRFSGVGGVGGRAVPGPTADARPSWPRPFGPGLRLPAMLGAAITGPQEVAPYRYFQSSIPLGRLVRSEGRSVGSSSTPLLSHLHFSAWGDQARRGAAGKRRVFFGTWKCRRKPLPKPRNAGDPQGATSGAAFLWVLSFGRAKESTSPSGARTRFNQLAR